MFQVILKGHLGGGTSDATWHSMSTGEIFYTDGISRTEKLRIRSNVYGIEGSPELFPLLNPSAIDLPCYLATNSSRKLACRYPIFIIA